MILKNGKRLDGCSDTVPVGTLNPFLGSVAPYGYLICEGQLVSKTTYKELYEICGDKFGTGTETEFRLPDLRGKTIVGYKEGDSTFGTLGGLLGSLTHAHDFVHTHGVPGVAHTHTIPEHNHDFKIGFLMNHYEPIVDNFGGQGAWSYSQNKYSKSHGNDSQLTSNYNSSHVQANTGPITEAIRYSVGDTSKTSLTTNSTTPSSTTTNSQSKSTTDSTSNLQPSITMNWIVKAFLLMPNQSYVSNHRQVSNTNTYSCDYINDLKTLILDMSHPIGSYYWSSDSTNPNLLFGGEWEQIKDKFVIAVGDSHEAGKSYGSNTKNLSHTHTTQSYKLTVNEMPNHKHAIAAISNNHIYNGTSTWDTGNSASFDMGEVQSNGRPSHNGTSMLTAYEWGGNQGSYYGSSAGGNQAHNHGDTGTSLSSTFDVTPACEAAYCWKRIG